MKIKFKKQAYQTAAVEAVVDCFAGQPYSDRISYRMDPGRRTGSGDQVEAEFETSAFKNADLAIPPSTLLENIQAVQRRQGIPLSPALTADKISSVNLTVEMETGTGKTYCYIKTIFEMNRRFGWSKFIIVVPSIAIREGVYKSLDITAEHFSEEYGKKARFFIYNSKWPHDLESFSSDAGINVMVINVQAFAARGEDARRIDMALDDFQSRKPIDVLRANRPILILDEPQKMEGKQTLESLKKFRPLMILRYSATHKTEYNKVFRLDALDAYNQKLVKKIAVRGITVRNLPGTNAYLYLESPIRVSPEKAPTARVEIEVRQNAGIKRGWRILDKGSNLFDLSKGLDQYRGFVVSEIDANSGFVEFANGVRVSVGDSYGDDNESTRRRIQIRETIKAHLEKEAILYNQGIKVLSLFFIDEVAKYRQYEGGTEIPGEYAKIFEEEYLAAFNEFPRLSGDPYVKYLESIDPAKTHQGYFSIDKKTKRLVDPEVGRRATESEDVDAYDLILKDKESLLQLSKPGDSAEAKAKRDVRFLFSHSALREGWDNPNVFVICTLKHSDNTITRRQEVGRGLRLCVNQNGDRVDDPTLVHKINVLTVVANESYKDFVTGLQKELIESLATRPRKATVEYFTDKLLRTETGNVQVTEQMAKQLYRYLVKNEYTDDNDAVTSAYHAAKSAGTLAPLPEELASLAPQLFTLIDTVFSEGQLPEVEDESKRKPNALNANFDKKEFKELWNRINRKAAYTVQFDSDELVKKATATLDLELRVEKLQYTVQRGEQSAQATYDKLIEGDAFRVSENEIAYTLESVKSTVKYDLLGKLAENTQLTRRTVAEILVKIRPQTFGYYQANPEAFIRETSRIINEQKATVIIEHLTYSPLDDRFEIDIFTADKFRESSDRSVPTPQRHIYDYVFTDSKVEREFVQELDASVEVSVYSKLPKGFFIPTPVGPYNPDWAIAFNDGKVRHVYFVAETKGSLSSMELRAMELSKIECARKFFAKITSDQVKYDVVTNFSQLMGLVK